MAANATGEADSAPLQFQFDRSIKLAFQSSSISSDGGLLLHRELDDGLGLIDLAVNHIADPRSGKNGRHRLAGLLRQSLFSRLAGYEDVNDADRLCRDPVMRQLVGKREADPLLAGLTRRCETMSSACVGGVGVNGKMDGQLGVSSGGVSRIEVIEDRSGRRARSPAERARIRVPSGIGPAQGR